MTEIIAFVNQKGGVGKTTSIINIAACLSENSNTGLNKKTLIIDMDPQGNSSQVYSQITDQDLSIYQLIHAKATEEKSPPALQDIKQSTYIKNLDILPANVLLSSAELDLVNCHARETILKRLLKDHKDTLSRYDYILIDCPPSLGLLTVNSIIAADKIVVPLHADVFSLTGLELITQTLEKLQQLFEINTTLCGFFFTQVSPNETLFQEAYALCKENYKNLLLNTYIRRNTAINHANATAQSIIHFDKDSSAAKDYLTLTKELTNTHA